MKKLKMAAVVAALVSAAQAYAIQYNLTFSGGGSAASGQIDVVGGVAVSGFLNVTSGANQGTFNLVTGGPGVQTFRLGDGTDLIYDNVVNVGSNPFLDGNGLAFANGPAQTAGTIGFNLWADGANAYTIFGDPPWGHPYTSGVATLSAVPDTATTSILLGSALAGLALLRRKFSV